MHYELKGRHEVCFKAKNRADGPSQHALDLPHLVLLKPKKIHPGFLLTFEQLYAEHHERTT